jgi:hypothetical protein
MDINPSKPTKCSNSLYLLQAVRPAFYCSLSLSSIPGVIHRSLRMCGAVAERNGSGGKREEALYNG